jgi:hypothetical protein
VFGIAVRAVGTEVEQEYQLIETDGAGIPVTVAVELIVDPTCMVPETAGPAVNTGAEDICAVDAVNMRVTPLADPLTADMALTLVTIYFPPSSTLGTYVESVCPGIATQSEALVALGSAFSLSHLNHWYS